MRRAPKHQPKDADVHAGDCAQRIHSAAECTCHVATAQDVAPSPALPAESLIGAPWETSVRSDGTEWHVCEAGGGDLVAIIAETGNADLTALRCAVLAEAPAMLETLRAAHKAMSYFASTRNQPETEAIRAILSRIDQHTGG